MADPDSKEAHESNPDQLFLEQSYLTYIVPFATNFKLEEAIGQGDEPNQSLFASIEQREWMFFGMRFALLSHVAILHC